MNWSAWIRREVARCVRGARRQVEASLCSGPLTKTEEKDTITTTAQADPLIPEEFLS
jgi:hypothetical protein